MISFPNVLTVETLCSPEVWGLVCSQLWAICEGQAEGAGAGLWGGDKVRNLCVA